MNNRTDLINLLARTINAQTYLEIGISTGDNFNKINVPYKVSVDIYLPCNATYPISSDDFFALNQEKFDLIFIDGYHQKNQVYRDIINSLSRLTQHGIIITHDTLPLSPAVIGPETCWDAWEAFVHFRKTDPSLYMASVRTDDDNGTGCGIIMHGKQELFEPKIQNVTFEYYIQNIEKLMNVISIDELMQTLIPANNYII